MSDSVISYRKGPFATVSMGLPGDHEGKTATRVFFVKGENKLALIDSGLYGGLPDLKKAFDELGYKKSDLDYLLITHEHMDHVGNNGWLKEETGCKILSHSGRMDRIADNMLNAKTIVHAFAEGEEFDLDPEYLDWMGPTAAGLDMIITEGDKIDLGGGIVLETIEFLGHSMAEIGFFEESTKTLVIADPLLPKINPVLYLYECPKTMRATFDKLERFLKERNVETVIFAHEEPMGVEGTMELLSDCRRRVDQVEKSILDAIKEKPGISFREIRDRACDDQGMVREWRALVSVNASLNAFEMKGVVKKENNGWVYCGE